MLLSLLFLTVFSILTGCHAGFLFKDADKCLCVFITKTQRNVVDGVCCIDEKTFSLSNPQRTFPFTEPHAGCVFDQFGAIREGKAKMPGNICKRHSVNMLLYIIQHEKVFQTARMAGRI